MTSQDQHGVHVPATIWSLEEVAVIKEANPSAHVEDKTLVESFKLPEELPEQFEHVHELFAHVDSEQLGTLADHIRVRVCTRACMHACMAMGLAPKF